MSATQLPFLNIVLVRAYLKETFPMELRLLFEVWSLNC